MKIIRICGFISFLALFGAAAAAGHDCHHGNYNSGDCWDCDHHGYRGPQSGSQYRGSGSGAATANLRTIEGKITEVVYLPGSAADNGMVEVRLQSGTESTLVRLAPSGFLKQQGLVLREGETVILKGYPVSGMEGDIFVATEVHHGERTVSLRDARGLPAW